MPRTNVRVCLTNRDRTGFSILARVTQALRKAGHADLAKMYQEEAIRGDYHQVLRIASEYVVIE